MLKTIENTIKSTVIFSNNDQYRYKLTRTWDEQKPQATVIMLNPSTADSLKTDKTVMNVNNFLIDNGYGSMTIVNLFAYISRNPKHLKNRKSKYEALNNDYLIKSFRSSDLIIIAWTRDKYKKRKKEVENILVPYQNKVMCFQDTSRKSPRHPRDLGEGWTLVEYQIIRNNPIKS